jgi:hypothetical protein
MFLHNHQTNFPENLKRLVETVIQLKEMEYFI